MSTRDGRSTVRRPCCCAEMNSRQATYTVPEVGSTCTFADWLIPAPRFSSISLFQVSPQSTDRR